MPETTGTGTGNLELACYIVFHSNNGHATVELANPIDPQGSEVPSRTSQDITTTGGPYYATSRARVWSRRFEFPRHYMRRCRAFLPIMLLRLSLDVGVERNSPRAWEEV